MEDSFNGVIEVKVFLDVRDFKLELGPVLRDLVISVVSEKFGSESFTTLLLRDAESDRSREPVRVLVRVRNSGLPFSS
jgi:hypothetical protein